MLVSGIGCSNKKQREKNMQIFKKKKHFIIVMGKGIRRRFSGSPGPARDYNNNNNKNTMSATVHYIII